MRKPDDGGQAFPTGDPTHGGYNGMTVLQFATIEIMKGLVSNPSVIAHNATCGWSLVNCNDDQLAGYAVKLASHAIEAVKAHTEDGHGRPSGEA